MIIVLAALLAAATSREASAQTVRSPVTCAPASGLIYVGDGSTPPTEFVDEQGRPAGIHIDLLKGIERSLGVPIKIRLMNRVDATSAVLRGDAHLTNLAHTAAREAQFDFLANTVRSRVSVLLHSGVRAVSGKSDLSGLRVTVSPGSYTLELLKKLPPEQRPELVLVANKDDAAQMWKDHEVHGMAGSGAAMVWMARGVGQRDFVEIPLETTSIQFATRKGCGESLAGVTEAMQQLRDEGAVDVARERWSTPPESNLWRTLQIAGLVFLTILTAVLAWTWSLRRQVRDRTAALEAAKEAAEAATKAKSEFLATMSHEIRTPLNAVIATASVLETTFLDHDQRELVAVIRQGGKSLLSVVSDVLDFSKVEAGRLELYCQPFDVRALLKETTALVTRHASDKGLDLRLTIDASAHQWLTGDVDRLRQVLLNLVSNAVKFTAHGSVEVTASAGETGRAGEMLLRVSVCDTGIGIPEDRLHRVFQPFTQADSSTTRRFGGTGLGLTISRRLIELMGGQIGVDSRPGHGSTFFFEVTLPSALTPAAALLQSHSSRPVALRTLMAEDNAVNRLVQRRMVTHIGHTCELACDGQEAVAAAAQCAYDVVILDLQMPVMGGLEAAQHIRTQAHRPWLIVLTADVTADTRQACEAAGVDDFLTKPITIEALSEALSRVPVRAAAQVA